MVIRVESGPRGQDLPEAHTSIGESRSALQVSALEEESMRVCTYHGNGNISNIWEEPEQESLLAPSS